MYSTLAAGLLAVGALAPEGAAASDAAISTSMRGLLFSPKAGTEPTKDTELKFKFFSGEGFSDGDEGNEGDEGFGTLGDEGNEGNEGDEGAAPGPGTPTGKGQSFSAFDQGSFESRATCTARASNTVYGLATGVAVEAITDAFAIVCNTARETKVEPYEVEGPFEKMGEAIASAMSASVAECESKGQAIACATSEAQALAWAESTSEAWARAYAEGLNSCNTCDPFSKQKVTASTEATARTIVELVAVAFSRAQTLVCVEGYQKVSASAASECFAEALVKVSAQAVAESLLLQDCLSPEADAFVTVATSADYTQLVKCGSVELTDGSGVTVETDTSGIDAQTDVSETETSS